MAIRYDRDKLPYDLVPPFAQEQYVGVLALGVKKYGRDNWRHPEGGLKWSRVIASAERHLAAIKKGEDYDSESGLLHSAHLMCNAAFLSEYHNIYPQGDDRFHPFLNLPKIGLDVDEVLADFVSAWIHSKYAEPKSDVPEMWNFDAKIHEKLLSSREDKDFWMNIPVKTNPKDIPFEPTCYITSRIIPNEWTEEWLRQNGFPTVPVITVNNVDEKIGTAKKMKVDIFVDDRYDNFVSFHRAGVFCYLFDAPHNQRYKINSHHRIFSLQDIGKFHPPRTC